jgi:uncharacterized protein
MQLTRDARSDVNLIRGYRPGAVQIGERVLSTHCIVAAETLITSFEVASVAELAAAHLEQIFALDPEVVLLGTGPRQSFPSGAVRQAFAERGIGLEAMDLGAACRTYNVLVQEERRVVALLFVR